MSVIYLLETMFMKSKKGGIQWNFISPKFLKVVAEMTLKMFPKV